MDLISETSAIEELKTKLNVKDVKDNDGIRFQHLEFGLKIFSVLHYCPNYVEASKIAIFYEPTLEAKSLRTKIQTTTQTTKTKI